MDSKTAERTGLAVLGVCFLLSVLGRGLGESFTVFLLPISQSFGWDRAEVVSIYSLTALCGGVAAPLTGRLFDRSGPRTVYTVGMGLLVGAFLAAAYAQKLWQFQLAIGASVGFGIACIGNVPNSILLGRWFGKRLTTAMAVVYSATGAGVLIMLPVADPDRPFRLARRLPVLRGRGPVAAVAAAFPAVAAVRRWLRASRKGAYPGPGR